jgi:Fe-S cluster assembly protein SufD
VVHRAPHTRSDFLLKVALADRSRSVFSGMIRMEREAQHSDAYQSNRNLLLGRGARSDSMPKLEILPDDVRCTHGSTTGTIQDEELFYLESRGLPRARARSLLVEAFLEEALRKLPDEPTSERYRGKLLGRLEGSESWAG